MSQHFSSVAGLMDGLNTAFQHIEPSAAFVEAVEGLVESVTSLVEQDPDASLATIHWVQRHDYVVWHSVHTALLTDVAAVALRWDQAKRRSIAAGALTMNIGMRTLQGALWNSSAPVTLQTQSALLHHPSDGVQLLRDAGVTDRRWFPIVAFHHERGDGGGYPHGCGKETFPIGARLVGLADLYCALASARAYRTPMLARLLKDTFLARAAMIDQSLGQFLGSLLGIYSPGSCVLLANGDVGVVVRRTPCGLATDCPGVRAVKNTDGQHYFGAPWRDTSRDTTKIVKPLPAELPGLPYPIEQLWVAGSNSGDSN